MNIMNKGVSDFSATKLAELNVDGFSSLVDGFESACKKHEHQVAFSCNGQDLTYSQLDSLSQCVAAYLLNIIGLKKGDRVAVQLPNCNQYPIVAWGIIRAGLVLVNTNPLYTSREIVHQFNDAQVKAVVVLDDLLPTIENLKNKTELLTIISVRLEALDFFDESSDLNADQYRSLNDVIKEGKRFDYHTPELSMSDTVMLQYTGGTTGPSKGAILSHGNIFASSRQTANALEVGEDIKEISIAPMPLYHIYGFTWNLVSCCLTGVQSVLIPNARDIDSLVKTMRGYQFTGFSGVNTLFASLLAHPDFDKIDFSLLAGSISGGAALVSSIAEEWEQRTGTKIFEGYALSETSSALACNLPRARRLGTVGKMLRAMEVKIIDDQGNQQSVGEAGELCVRGPQVTQGYWGRPDATAEAIDEDGWFKTGDVATISDDGYISIVDRLKDVVIVSGFNVYPNEVEDVICGHSDVFECAVIGVADNRSGEAVKAFVVRCGDGMVDEESLRSYCRELLTAYKVPKYIEFVPELPKSNVGKILRRKLR